MNRLFKKSSKERWFISFFISFGLLFLFCATSNATESQENKREALVLFLIRSNPSPTEVRLASMLTAHLSTIPAGLEVAKLEEHEVDEEKKTKRASALADDQKAVAVVWLFSDESAISLFAPDLGSEPRSLTADNLEAGSADWCEAMAVLVHSDVLALLPHAPVDKFEPKKEVFAQPIEEKKEIIVAVSKRRFNTLPHGISVWIGVDVGYAPSFPVDGKDMLHRVRIATHLGLGRYIYFGMSADLGPPTSFFAGEESVDLAEQTLRLIVGSMANLKRFYAGGGLGGVLSIVTINGIDEPLVSEASSDIQILPGISFFALFGVRASSWLSLFVQGGVDIHNDVLNYTIEDETVMRLRRVAPFVSVGATVHFGVREGEKR